MPNTSHPNQPEQPAVNWNQAESLRECELILNANKTAMKKWSLRHKPIVIMCPPTYFRVDAGKDKDGSIAGNGFIIEGLKEFSKNPVANRQQMQQEWASLQDVLRSKGAHIICMEPHPDYPDQVFTADHSFSCVYVDRKKTSPEQIAAKTIISKLAHPYRLTEHQLVSDFFMQLKTRKETSALFENRDIIMADADFEGTGENLVDPNRGIILSGYGYRNAKDTALTLQKTTGLPVYSLENKQPFFHIDTYCSVLPGGYVLYAPDVMHPATINTLERVMFKGHASLKEKYAIPVSKEDAYQFACNAVILGENIIMHQCSDQLKSELAAKELNVTYIDITIAKYAGGGIHCMTNQLNQPVFI